MKKIYTEPRYTSMDIEMEQGVLTGKTSLASNGTGALSNSLDATGNTFDEEPSFDWRE